MSKLFHFFKETDGDISKNSIVYISICRANKLLNEKGEIQYRIQRGSWNKRKIYTNTHEALLICPRNIEEEPEPKCDHMVSPIEIYGDVSHMPATQQTMRMPLPRWMKFCPKCSKDLRCEN